MAPDSLACMGLPSQKAKAEYQFILLTEANLFLPDDKNRMAKS
jgi:hypothetical protein